MATPQREGAELTPRDRARLRGREAFYDGRPADACPYEDSSEEWNSWMGGWEAARRFRDALDDHLRSQA